MKRNLIALVAGSALLFGIVWVLRPIAPKVMQVIPGPTVLVSKYTPVPIIVPQCSTVDVTVAVLGIDERDNNYIGFNTDAIWLVHFASNEIRVLSLPRDLVAAYPPGVGYEEQRVNWAWYLGDKHKYPDGGFGLLRDVLKVNWGITVDHYILINFRAFVDTVDALGGIDVDVPEAIQDDQFPEDFGFNYQAINFEAGPQHMNGVEALRYARIRHGDGDSERSERQKLLLEALRAKATESWLALPTVMANLAQSVRTDFMPDPACLTQPVRFILIDDAAAPTVRETLGLVRRSTPELFDPLIQDWLGK